MPYNHPIYTWVATAGAFLLKVRSILVTEEVVVVSIDLQIY